MPILDPSSLAQRSSATETTRSSFHFGSFSPCLSELPGTVQVCFICAWAHLLDVGCVSQHHGQAINAHTPASSGRQAVLQASTEALINEHGFIITLGLGLHLTPQLHCLAVAM